MPELGKHDSYIWQHNKKTDETEGNTRCRGTNRRQMGQYKKSSTVRAVGPITGWS